jgi:hypothetical protein
MDLIPPFLDPRFEDAARRLRDGLIGGFSSTAVFAGTVIEAALRDQLLRHRDIAGDVSKWDLPRMIKASMDLGIVSDRIAALPQAVQQYRGRADRTTAHDRDVKFGIEELRVTLEVLELLRGRVGR